MIRLIADRLKAPSANILFPDQHCYGVLLLSRLVKLKKATRFILIFSLMPVCFLESLGCAARDTYTYHRIQSEFKGKSSIPVMPHSGSSKTVQEALSEPLSIKRAINIALERNPDMDMAISRIQQSDALIDEAFAAFWPVLSFYVEYLQGDAPSAYLFKTIDQRELPERVDFNDPGWFENYETGIHGRINIFNGGRDLLRKKMAETGLEIRELDLQSIQNALITSVINAFYSTLAARDFIKIAQASVRTVEAQLRITKARYQAGGALKSDVLSLEVRLAQAKEDLIRAENNYSLSKASLANLLGEDPDTSLDLAGMETVPIDLPKDYASGLVQALANRPELRKVRLEIVQSRMALDTARSEYLPRLDLQAKYYLDDANFDFERERENWTAGIILNWDLFTGFDTKAKADRATRVLEEMMAMDRKTALAIQLDLKTSYLKLEEAKARLAVTEASAAQADESLRLVKKQYEGGSATITRYLETELALNRARIRSTAAFYDREKTRAAVGRALGYWGKYAGGDIHWQ